MTGRVNEATRKTPRPTSELQPLDRNPGPPPAFLRFHLSQVLPALCRTTATSSCIQPQACLSEVVWAVQTRIPARSSGRGSSNLFCFLHTIYRPLKTTICAGETLTWGTIIRHQRFSFYIGKRIIPHSVRFSFYFYFGDLAHHLWGILRQLHGQNNRRKLWRVTQGVHFLGTAPFRDRCRTSWPWGKRVAIDFH